MISVIQEYAADMRKLKTREKIFGGDVCACAIYLKHAYVIVMRAISIKIEILKTKLRFYLTNKQKDIEYKSESMKSCRSVAWIVRRVCWQGL